MVNRTNLNTRKVKVEFLRKLRTGDKSEILRMKCQLMTTEQLVKRVCELLLPWMKANDFQDVDSLEEAIRKQGLQNFSYKLCQDVFDYYQQKKQYMI